MLFPVDILKSTLRCCEEGAGWPEAVQPVAAGWKVFQV